MNLKEVLLYNYKSSREYLRVFINWTFLSCFVGVTGGLIGVAFYKSLALATAFRMDNPWLIYFLPFAGLVIVFLYRVMGLKKDPGTNLLITAVVAHEQKVPQRMAFLIFTATVITHLFGGSAGREG
ncbi:MAG: chloride channel protein, partial [Oscillospiraceae bacterium]|nr:chloride channel protein [Oscillospiraceae bacterium]